MSLFKPPNRSNWQSSSLEGNEAQTFLSVAMRDALVPLLKQVIAKLRGLTLKFAE